MLSVKLFIQTSKGIIRDQVVRRWAMAVLLVAALLMLGAGATFLNGWLLADKWIFLLYWIACGWLTMTAILLSIFDLLAVRLMLRREKRQARMETFGKDIPEGKD